MWEYKRINIKFSIYSELTEALNIEGQDGWEVIYYHEETPEKYCVNHNSYAKILFKRLK